MPKIINNRTIHQAIFPEELLTTLRRSRRTTILTGAGISAESGIPTFREAQTGLWSQYEPERLATRAAFAADPKLVWEWYAWRRELIARAVPNAGHAALVDLELMLPDVAIVTQNVDGFHRLAGSRSVIELHGNIGAVKCFDADHPIAEWETLSGTPPRCPECGSYCRPDVVWFGEGLPRDALMTAADRAQSSDIFFSIGTSSMVQPAASLTVEAIQAPQTLVVEVNIGETPISNYVDIRLEGPAGEVLPQLVKALKADAP